MRAVVYERTGGPEVLHEVDLATVEPGPGEVRVVVARSGVNPTDWKSRQGAAGSNVTVRPAQTPNQDGAGRVDAVGEGVDRALLGRRVWIWEAARDRPRGGTAQQQTVLPVRHVVGLPDAVGGRALDDAAAYDLGASLGIPFLTAHRCLTVTEGGPTVLGPGALQGRVVLVAGGAGAVGNAAIQLARWSDATVLTTVSSPRKAQLAAAAGADHVVDYRQQDVVEEVRRIAPHGVHTVVEVAPGPNAAIDTRVVAPNGSIAVYADDDTAEMTLAIRPSMLTNARWQFVLVYTEPAPAKAAAVDAVARAVAAGAIRVGEAAGLPLHHFGFDDVAGAHQAVQDRVVGKVLVDVP